MIESDRTLTPAELREALDAECKLAAMDLYEDVAALYAEETCPLMRRWYADRYRTLVGVHPDQRDEHRRTLEGMCRMSPSTP